MRENIELYGLHDEAQIVEVCVDEYGAAKHPGQADAYVLSFNSVPLPDSLVEALATHPKLFPNDILIRWTQEQDLIFEASLGQLRGQAVNS